MSFPHFARPAPDPFNGSQPFPWFQVVEIPSPTTEAIKLDFLTTLAIAQALAQKFNLKPPKP